MRRLTILALVAVRATCTSITDSSRIDANGDNLTGSSGLVDANGFLTGTNRTNYLGTRGFELPEPAGGGVGDGVRSRVRIGDAQQ